MWPHRVVAHDDFMFTDYEFSRGLVIDRQQQLRETARQHRLAGLGRRAQRAEAKANAKAAADQADSRVHYLPARVWRTGDGETRAAS
jgi:hypothetical protein